jgi:hypothetical protein
MCATLAFFRLPSSWSSHVLDDRLIFSWQTSKASFDVVSDFP